MPRGVPAAGFRVTKALLEGRSTQTNVPKEFGVQMPNPTNCGIPAIMTPTAPVDDHRTDDEIEMRIATRFRILEDLVHSVIDGEVRSLIVSGPAGLGKSYTIEKEFSDWDPDETNYKIVKGYVRASGLYKLLYEFRNPNQVIIFDDADSVFYDDVSLNFLKAVCDSNDRRRVNYLSEAKLVLEDGEVVPNSFDFEGRIIFITNLDFDQLIERGHKLKPHFEALMSRSHYVDLMMKSARDYIIRIKQIFRPGKVAYEDHMIADVINFIEEHRTRLREISLRTALKIANIRRSRTTSWKIIAETTCCRNA